MEKIFNYLKPENNEKISSYSGLDLQDIIYYINKYYLELRDNIGIDENITFGLELEFEKADLKKIKETIDKNHLNKNWVLGYDNSLFEGGELKSPILTDNTKSWEELKKACDCIKPYGVVWKNTGGHIHVGSQVLENNPKYLLNFIKLWSTYENIIFRFGYNESLKPRPDINKYAECMAKKFWEDYNHLKKYKLCSFDDVIYLIARKKDQAVNLLNVYRDNKKTIEFRNPNGTLNPVIWQNNVNLFVKLLNYSKSANFDDDKIEKRREKMKDIYSDIPLYSQIYLDQVLEFTDMIFDNNLDKIYFLRQYLKSFKSHKKANEKIETFTKIKAV